MNYKIYALGIIWFFVALFWIVVFSSQDKEWMIGSGEIKNICDLIYLIEKDDVRDVGIIVTLPLFFPAIYVLIIKKKHHWFIWLITLCLTGYWLWQFIIRYQLCLC